MSLIYVPLQLMRMQGHGLELTGRVISPGFTGAGVTPKVSTDGGGLWRYEIQNLQLTTKDLRRAWRAITAKCDGGVNKLVVPFFDREHQPWPLDGDGEPITFYDQVTFDDDALFDDETGFAQPVIDAISVGSVALRATSMVIRFLNGGPLVGGEHFSIQHSTMLYRLYRVVGVEINDDGDSVVTFRPPLREAIADETEIDFDYPRCVMEPLDPSGLDSFTDINQIARPSPVLIEAFTSEMLA